MDIQTFAEKYNINDLDNFKQDMLAYFAKSNEFKTKRDEVMKTFDELQKKMQDAMAGMSKTTKTSSKKTELGPFASKAAKLYAEENEIDPSTVTGTGSNDKDGNPRITKGDLVKLTKPATKTRKSKQQKTVPKGCNGVLASGESCSKGAVYEIDGRWYCGFHKKQAHTEEDEDPEAVDSDDGFDYDTENENDNDNKVENIEDESTTTPEVVEKTEEVEEVEVPDEKPVEKKKTILKTEIAKPKRKIIKKKA